MVTRNIKQEPKDIYEPSGLIDRHVATALIWMLIKDVGVPCGVRVGPQDLLDSLLCCTPEVRRMMICRGRKKLGLGAQRKPRSEKC